MRESARDEASKRETIEHERDEPEPARRCGRSHHSIIHATTIVGRLARAQPSLRRVRRRHARSCRYTAAVRTLCTRRGTRRGTRRARLAALPLAALVGAAAVARADGLHVRLRGVARIEAQGVRGDGGDVVVRGSLTDDAGAPLSDGPLTIAIARASSPASPLRILGPEVGARLRRPTHAPRPSSPTGCTSSRTPRGAFAFDSPSRSTAT